jgi:hypothetical protein
MGKRVPPGRWLHERESFRDRSLSFDVLRQVATLLASLFWLSQAGSIFFPGADFFDPEYAHLVPKVSGIRFNQAMIDTVVLLFIAIAYLLEQGRMKRA